MSSRALRRLQEQKLEEKLTEITQLSDDEVPANDLIKKKKNKTKTVKSGNLFDVLTDENVLCNDDDMHETQSIEEDTIKPSIEEDAIKINGIHDSPEKCTNKKKKKKKGKKSENKKENKKDELDEIDRSIKEVNEILGIKENATVIASTSEGVPVFRSKSVLIVDPRNLNPSNEMRRRFGASVVQNSDRRRNSHERKFKRTTCLITPRQNWPPYTKVGIAMSQIKSERCKYLFSFEHQESYRKVQFMFYDAVESADHNNIIALLNNHPYHIDSMLQLSEICKINEDFQMAAELIERALFVFECSFHTLFNVTQGTCRLDYKRTENRPFFLALFRHIHYTGNKACYRTALEFCKILLGLDPSEDPLCVLLMLDYYALKAEEYKYFIQLTDEYECSRNVSLLPNFAYSYALAKLHTGKLVEADKALRKALISFPSLLIELMDKNGILLDDVIKMHPYFDPVSYIKQSPSLNQLISLFVGRCHVLWKPAEVLNWIVENCKYIIDHTEELREEKEAAKMRRETRYKSSPRNVLRHIIISDVKEAVRHLPVDVRNQTVMQYDPLPPLDSVSGYERPIRTIQRQGNGNLMSLFLQSLMPSYNQEQVQLEGQQRVNERRDPARALEQDDQRDLNAIQGGAQQLMNALRELLNTMTYRNERVQPEEQEVDDDEHPNEDEWLA